MTKELIKNINLEYRPDTSLASYKQISITLIGGQTFQWTMPPEFYEKLKELLAPELKAEIKKVSVALDFPDKEESNHSLI